MSQHYFKVYAALTLFLAGCGGSSITSSAPPAIPAVMNPAPVASPNIAVAPTLTPSPVPGFRLKPPRQ
jgi:hypothetical protein